MRTVTDGRGRNSTAAVAAWLAGHNQLTLANLYLIGEPEDPNAQWLTDWQSPLTWSWMGTFYPASIPSRGSVSSKIGFEVATFLFEWAPKNLNFVQDIQRTSPYQQAYLGKFDGQPFRAWTVYMPTAGDADTFGASELFGGRIGNSEVGRASIKFTVNSFLDVVNQQVPGSVIEVLNSIAGFKGATPPAGLTVIPKFSVFSVNPNNRLILANCLSPTPGQIFATGAFQGGFIQFIIGSLAGLFSAVEQNAASSSPTGHNTFQLFNGFPWAPAVGDVFYASATFPINQVDGQYFGFPYVPDPSSAL